ncbi:MAG: hypothetical protein DSY87_08160 [Methylococcus sp.]|nr:MAG: hypothetical protein DSY87_08160 [Methylococcus sp.]
MRLRSRPEHWNDQIVSKLFFGLGPLSNGRPEVQKALRVKGLMNGMGRACINFKSDPFDQNLVAVPRSQTASAED